MADQQRIDTTTSGDKQYHESALRAGLPRAE